MFGKDKNKQPQAGEPQREVPVFTVHTLPRPYEVICTVFSSRINTAFAGNVLQKLGQAGGAISECDAVIGIVVVGGGQLVHAYGTAIRYLD